MSAKGRENIAVSEALAVYESGTEYHPSPDVKCGFVVCLCHFCEEKQ